jgi:hypothetical protein
MRRNEMKILAQSNVSDPVENTLLSLIVHQPEELDDDEFFPTLEINVGARHNQGSESSHILRGISSDALYAIATAFNEIADALFAKEVEFYGDDEDVEEETE